MLGGTAPPWFLWAYLPKENLKSGRLVRWITVPLFASGLRATTGTHPCPFSSTNSKYNWPDKMDQRSPECAEVALQERNFERMRLGAYVGWLALLMFLLSERWSNWGERKRWETWTVQHKQVPFMLLLIVIKWLCSGGDKKVESRFITLECKQMALKQCIICNFQSLFTIQLSFQWSPTFLALGTGFMEDHFSTDGGGVQAVMWAMGKWGEQMKLRSCCEAWFLTGYGPIPVHGPGVGDPCFTQISSNLCLESCDTAEKWNYSQSLVSHHHFVLTRWLKLSFLRFWALVNYTALRPSLQSMFGHYYHGSREYQGVFKYVTCVPYGFLLDCIL